MNPKLRPLSKLLKVKPEPQTTPALGPSILRENAPETVSSYHVTPALRDHLIRIFDCLVHKKGQGFWVQAEYGAGKTHFLATLIDLLVWRDEGVWGLLRDPKLKSDYSAAVEKLRLFPVAFSLKGMGETDGSDSLMRVLEEQIRESLKTHAPDLEPQVKITSADLAAHWFQKEASEDEKAAITSFFGREHKTTTEEFLKAKGPKKLGEEIVRSRLADGRLRGKLKERLTFLQQQICKLGGYDGLLVVIDEFRSWQDRHLPGTRAHAEDEDVLETLAFVLPSEGVNVVTVVASQGDMPQKLSGGGKGDRFIPLPLLADKNKGDFGEIVVFRCRELVSGAATDVKDYYDHCRKEYRFIKQGNISQEYFQSIFPFQPRCFEVLRRITQSAEQHNLPTARSAIRMAWQALSAGGVLSGRRLLTLSDIIHTPELTKGLQSEGYREASQSLEAAVELLTEFDSDPDEREQARRVLETLFLWVISVPASQRDGLTAPELAEAAWLADDALESADKAEHILERLVSGGFPVRVERKTRDGKEVAVYSFELASGRENPGKHFAPLKKKAKEDAKGQDARWAESLFWGLADLTSEAQQELGVNGGVFTDFGPPDVRSEKDRKEGKQAIYAFPHFGRAVTKRVHDVVYPGEVVVADRWKEEYGREIENPDEHFRIVYLTSAGDVPDAKISSDLKDLRIAVIRPNALTEDTREALAELIAAEQMKRVFSAPSQTSLREYADSKRRDAVKAMLKSQLAEFQRGKVLTQKGYGIPAIELFKPGGNREDDLAGRLLDKAYDTPLFAPKLLKKSFTDGDARKLFAGLFHKDAAAAEKAAVQNFGAGLEVVLKSHPSDFNLTASQALPKIRELVKASSDIPLSELTKAICRPPWGLTEGMVVLYALSLVKSGGFEILLKPGTGAVLTDGKPIPGDRITPHTVPNLEWNAKLDKALLGARVLDPSFKPASTPEEEAARDAALMARLTQVTREVSEVEKAVAVLAQALSAPIPAPLKENLARITALAAAGSYTEFDASVRTSFESLEAFEKVFRTYAAIRDVKETALNLSLLTGYVRSACDVDDTLSFDREMLRASTQLGALLENPSLVIVRATELENWKTRYVHEYRKAHRAHYEDLQQMRARVESLRPRVLALVRMNGIVELGPVLPGTAGVKSSLDALDRKLWSCPDAGEAPVADQSPICPKCSWRPDSTLPSSEVDTLAGVVEKGLLDRFQRFKDASVYKVLAQAVVEEKQPGLAEILDVIQVADAEKLTTILTDPIVAVVRKLLYDESLVDEEILLGPLTEEIGAIEESRSEDALDHFKRLLRRALKDARAKHGPEKRIRFFLR